MWGRTTLEEPMKGRTPKPLSLRQRRNRVSTRGKVTTEGGGRPACAAAASSVDDAPDDAALVERCLAQPNGGGVPEGRPASALYPGGAGKPFLVLAYDGAGGGDQAAPPSVRADAHRQATAAVGDRG